MTVRGSANRGLATGPSVALLLLPCLYPRLVSIQVSHGTAFQNYPTDRSRWSIVCELFQIAKFSVVLEGILVYREQGFGGIDFFFAT